MSATLNWTPQSIGGACQSSEIAALLNSLYFVFKNLFLPKYCVKHYDYIVKLYNRYNVIGVYCWILPKCWL